MHGNEKTMIRKKQVYVREAMRNRRDEVKLARHVLYVIHVSYIGQCKQSSVGNGWNFYFILFYLASPKINITKFNRKQNKII